MSGYKMCFDRASIFGQQLAVGDAIWWIGPVVWRVEAIEGDNHTAGLWPSSEPYPTSIREFGPGEWPDDPPPTSSAP